MSAALIVGASRGIGLEFVKQYAAHGVEVVGTARDEAGLERIIAAGGDALEFDALLDDPKILIDTCGTKLALCVLNAGVYGPKAGAGETFSQDEFDHVMRTNVFVAMRLIPALAPALVGARGKLVTVSSRMGSLGERASSNGTAYRASKAALNSVLKDASLAFGPKGVTCVTVHPGWVRTDMGGAGADLSVEESVSGLRRVIADIDASDNGCFINYDGSKIAW
jgi:NAD(P)-dependent dehydrogenase (short-subunit alcohol dehydrogenase family)